MNLVLIFVYIISSTQKLSYSYIIQTFVPLCSHHGNC